ncbi:LysR family transcriptional regulator [Rahnella sp. PAMC25617]|jgi:DNA-binding transcriptional LysR family regulator|uniref:LysR family transcriptional regulator n=1 Tax=Rahnella TaxID=34037 RepID=UPI000DD4020D|nr:MULTISPECIES: LysR family transcriptional regulator [Rahnella]MDH2898320.1 LysR family transcriptional regulator [Rahnella variigena]RYJ16317.1 LysR family transcriptional regulator [Rahnella variigena]TCQ90292.1 DNA-binding transcriptional LysR family regulator [Rahnella sp. JUb53]
MNEPSAINFDYNLIKIMNEVIVSGNISKAAENLSLTPSAISLSINKLRRHLGEDLFYRTATGLKPTATALDIHDSFVNAITIIEDVLQSTKTEGPSCPILRVMCPDVLEDYYFNRMYKNDSGKAVKVEFSSTNNIKSDEMVKSLLHANIDVVISHHVLQHEKITSVKMDAMDNFVILCGANSLLSNQKELALLHYYALPHAVYNDGVYTDFTNLLGTSLTIDAPYAGLVKVIYRSSSINGIISALERSDMLTVLPRMLADYFIRERNCKLKYFDLPKEISIKQSPVYMHYLSNSSKRRYVHMVLSQLKAVEPV